MFRFILLLFLSVSLFSQNLTKESFYKFGKSETTFSRVSILATGDVLIYDSNYKAFKNGGSVQDFYEMFAECSSEIASADFSIVNMEVTPGGENFGYQGYPRFNAPFALADALNKAGFDMFATANNHSFDHGVDAIKKSTEYYKSKNYLWSGTSFDKNDYMKFVNFEKNGIKISVVSITDLTNEIILNNHLVNTSYKKGDRENIKKKMKEISQTSDVIIVILHYGQEYINYPDNYQKKVIQYFADSGADIIFAGHSHTLQPVDFIKNSSGKNVYVTYSMGNFVSWMSGGQLEKQVGALFKIDIVKEHSEIFNKTSIYLDNPKANLTYTVNYGNEHKTIFLKNAKKYIPNFNLIYKHYINHLKFYYDGITVE